MISSAVKCRLILTASFSLLAASTVFGSGFFGVSRNQNLYNDIEEMNVAMVRESIYWAAVQPYEDVWTWENFDARVAACNNRGLELMPELMAGQCWATGVPLPETQQPSYMPLDFTNEWDDTYGHSETYYIFVYEVVARYIDYIKWFSIENEVVVRRYWDGDEKDYAKLLKTAYKAAHDANPDVIVTDSGLPSYLWGTCIINDLILSDDFNKNAILHFANGYFYRMNLGTFPNYDSLVEWIGTMQKNMDFMYFLLYKMNSCVDALNIHFGEDYYYISRILEWLEYLGDEYGMEYKRYLSNELAQRYFPPEGWSDTHATYAMDTFKCMITAISQGFDKVCYFPFTDKDLVHDKYGLLDEDFEWTESALTYQFLAGKIGEEFKFLKKQEHHTIEDIECYIFASKIDSSLLYFCWWDDGSHQFGKDKIKVRMDEEVFNVKQYDYLGNLTVLTKPREIEYFRISEEPVCYQAMNPIFDFEILDQN